MPIPENAVPSTFGDSWDCKPGFMKKGTACATVTVPEHAFGTGSAHGSGWECRRGFREANVDSAKPNQAKAP